MIETRKITAAGLLGAISIIMGFTQLGFIPVPTPAGSATIMHIPAIVAGIIEGPVVGLFVGLIFGISSFIRGAAFFTDPIVAIIPRLFIGVAAFYVFQAFKKYPVLAIGMAAAIGTLVNTIGVLSLAVIKNYIPSWYVAGGILVAQGLPEIIVAIIMVILVVRPLQKLIK